MAPGADAGHEPIAWAGTQVGADVEARCDPDQDDPAQKHRPGAPVTSAAGMNAR